MADQTLAILAWASAGLLMGILNLFLQKLSIQHARKISANKMVAESSLFSLARIALALIVLFFAFQKGILIGLACLFAFIITRWVGLIFLLRVSKERK